MGIHKLDNKKTWLFWQLQSNDSNGQELKETWQLIKNEPSYFSIEYIWCSESGVYKFHGILTGVGHSLTSTMQESES